VFHEPIFKGVFDFDEEIASLHQTLLARVPARIAGNDILKLWFTDIRLIVATVLKEQSHDKFKITQIYRAEC
jgi:hypothetical protein